MKDFTNPLIDTLIKSQRQIYKGFDWSRTDKLKPTDDADRDHTLSETLRPLTGLRGEDQDAL